MVLSNLLSQLENDDVKYYLVKGKELITEDKISVLQNDNDSYKIGFIMPKKVGGFDIDSSWNFYIDYLDGKEKPGYVANELEFYQVIRDDNIKGASLDWSTPGTIKATFDGRQVSIPIADIKGNTYHTETNDYYVETNVKYSTDGRNYVSNVHRENFEDSAEVSPDYPSAYANAIYFTKFSKNLTVSAKRDVTEDRDMVEYIYLEWVLDSKVTKEPGKVVFSIRMENSAGYKWQSLTGEFTVKPNLKEFYYLQNEVEENYVIQNRKIVPVGNFENILVKGDTNSNKLFYKMNRYFQGQDMLAKKTFTTQGSTYDVFKINNLSGDAPFVIKPDASVEKYKGLDTNYIIEDAIFTDIESNAFQMTDDRKLKIMYNKNLYTFENLSITKFYDVTSSTYKFRLTWDAPATLFKNEIVLLNLTDSFNILSSSSNQFLLTPIFQLIGTGFEINNQVEFNNSGNQYIIVPVFNRLIRFVFSDSEGEYADFDDGEIEYINDEENYFIFSWTPDNRATRAEGELNYTIEFYINATELQTDINGNAAAVQTKSYSWSTLPSTIRIEDNVAATGNIEFIPNWVAYIENNISKDLDSYIVTEIQTQYNAIVDVLMNRFLATYSQINGEGPLKKGQDNNYVGAIQLNGNKFSIRLMADEDGYIPIILTADTYEPNKYYYIDNYKSIQNITDIYSEDKYVIQEGQDGLSFSYSFLKDGVRIPLLWKANATTYVPLTVLPESVFDKIPDDMVEQTLRFSKEEEYSLVEGVSIIPNKYFYLVEGEYVLADQNFIDENQSRLGDIQFYELESRVYIPNSSGEYYIKGYELCTESEENEYVLDISPEFEPTKEYFKQSDNIPSHLYIYNSIGLLVESSTLSLITSSTNYFHTTISIDEQTYYVIYNFVQQTISFYTLEDNAAPLVPTIQNEVSNTLAGINNSIYENGVELSNNFTTLNGNTIEASINNLINFIKGYFLKDFSESSETSIEEQINEKMTALMALLNQNYNNDSNLYIASQDELTEIFSDPAEGTSHIGLKFEGGALPTGFLGFNDGSRIDYYNYNYTIENGTYTITEGQPIEGLWIKCTNNNGDLKTLVTKQTTPDFPELVHEYAIENSGDGGQQTVAYNYDFFVNGDDFEFWTEDGKIENMSNSIFKSVGECSVTQIRQNCIYDDNHQIIYYVGADSVTGETYKEFTLLTSKYVDSLSDERMYMVYSLIPSLYIPENVKVYIHLLDASQDLKSPEIYYNNPYDREGQFTWTAVDNRYPVVYTLKARFENELAKVQSTLLGTINDELKNTTSQIGSLLLGGSEAIEGGTGSYEILESDADNDQINTYNIAVSSDYSIGEHPESLVYKVYDAIKGTLNFYSSESTDGALATIYSQVASQINGTLSQLNNQYSNAFNEAIAVIQEYGKIPYIQYSEGTITITSKGNTASSEVAQ